MGVSESKVVIDFLSKSCSRAEQLGNVSIDVEHQVRSPYYKQATQTDDR